MLVCFNCNRAFETGKYCKFCGSLLKDKEVNYETTGTLLRSNLIYSQMQKASIESQIEQGKMHMEETDWSKKKDQMPLERGVLGARSEPSSLSETTNLPTELIASKTGCSHDDRMQMMDTEPAERIVRPAVMAGK